MTYPSLHSDPRGRSLFGLFLSIEVMPTIIIAYSVTMCYYYITSPTVISSFDILTLGQTFSVPVRCVESIGCIAVTNGLDSDGNMYFIFTYIAYQSSKTLSLTYTSTQNPILAMYPDCYSTGTDNQRNTVVTLG